MSGAICDPFAAEEPQTKTTQEAPAPGAQMSMANGEAKATGYWRESGRGGRAGDARALGDLASLPGNDVGNAWRFVARFGGDFCFLPGIGWLGYTGTHWDRADGARLAKMAAQETARLIAGEEDHIQRLDGETTGDFEKRIKARRAWSRDSGMTARVVGMLAQAEPHLTKAVSELDPDPFKIACRNGTITLLKPPADAAGAGVEPEELHRFEPGHRREDMITRLAPVEYDPDAVAPAWQAFLDDVQPEPEVQAYLGRSAGYWMTGDVSEEKIFVFEGKGRNGKGVFVDVIQAILGDMAQPFMIETLLADERRSGASASPDLAKLRGARLAVTGEPARGAKLDDGRVKALTGGDAIQARGLYQAPFEFRPTFKIIVSWNTRPAVGSDDGIWARLLVLPWRVQVLDRLPDGSPNPQWKPKSELMAAFRAELPGILNWILWGYGNWALQRIAPPEIVRRTVRAYRDEVDEIGAFLMDCCDVDDPGITTAVAAIMTAYHEWCRANGRSPMSAQALGRGLSERGYERVKSGAWFRKGIRVLPEALGPDNGYAGP